MSILIDLKELRDKNKAAHDKAEALSQKYMEKAPKIVVAVQAIAEEHPKLTKAFILHSNDVIDACEIIDDLRDRVTQQEQIIRDLVRGSGGLEFKGGAKKYEL